MKNSISDMRLSSLVDISNSTRVVTSAQSLHPPIFPPPLPPTSKSGANDEHFNSNSNSITNSTLAAPSIPAPLPPVFMTSNSSIISNSKSKHHLIVKLNDSNKQAKNLIQIKIENNNLLDELSAKFGYDKSKVACALLIANNDITIAHDILKKISKV